MHRQALIAVGVGIGTVAYFPPDSADEVLEVLVLGQASLLGIVLSVSLLSVQISTNQYAPQLSRVYRGGTFNTIMSSFAISILFALSLRTGLPLLSDLQIALVVGVSTGLAAWSFEALFTLEQRLLGFLNPDPILDELIADVSLSRYRAFTDRHREEGRMARNPLLEIFQIARTALEQNNNYIALRAVEALEEATHKIITDIGALTAEQQRSTTTSTHRVILHALIDGLRNIGEQTLEQTQSEITCHVVQAVGRACERIHESRRLETRYTESLSVFTQADNDEIAAATTNVILSLAKSGVDTDLLGELLESLATNGHRDLVIEKMRDGDIESSTRDTFLNLVDRHRSV